MTDQPVTFWSEHRDQLHVSFVLSCQLKLLCTYCVYLKCMIVYKAALCTSLFALISSTVVLSGTLLFLLYRVIRKWKHTTLSSTRTRHSASLLRSTGISPCLTRSKSYPKCEHWMSRTICLVSLSFWPRWLSQVLIASVQWLHVQLKTDQVWTFLLFFFFFFCLKRRFVVLNLHVW